MIRLLLIFNIILASNYSFGWKLIRDQKLYTFSVPDYMGEMNDLNAEANSQMGYVEQKEDIVEELYIIILAVTNKEIEESDPGAEYTVRSYYELGLGFLTESIDKFEILADSVVVKQRNKMEVIDCAIYGKLGDIEVVYYYSVYKGRKAYYQVLSWTLKDQYPLFRREMQQMNESLREK